MDSYKVLQKGVKVGLGTGSAGYNASARKRVKLVFSPQMCRVGIIRQYSVL